MWKQQSNWEGHSGKWREWQTNDVVWNKPVEVEEIYDERPLAAAIRAGGSRQVVTALGCGLKRTDAVDKSIKIEEKIKSTVEAVAGPDVGISTVNKILKLEGYQDLARALDGAHKSRNRQAHQADLDTLPERFRIALSSIDDAQAKFQDNKEALQEKGKTTNCNFGSIDNWAVNKLKMIDEKLDQLVAALPPSAPEIPLQELRVNSHIYIYICIQFVAYM